MFQLTHVVKNLLIINVVAYVLTHFVGPAMGFNWLDKLSVYYPTSGNFTPAQVVTYMFMHGNLMHIFFNMFALVMFGPPIEAAWGPKRFLFYYFFTGFGALALQLLVQYFELQSIMQQISAEPIEFQEQVINAFMDSKMLGASGAVFGLLAAYGMQFPNNIIQMIFPPISMKAKYFVMIYAGIEIFLGVGRFNTSVAHFAHVGGALFGVLLILYWRQRGERLY